MPRYRVTGGPGGDAGIDIGDKRYEPGDTLDAAAKTVKWLVDDGYLTQTGKTAAAQADEEE
jgi:hypothetical protein